MSNVVIVGDPRAIFGAVPDLPVRIPAGAKAYKIKQRPGMWARMYLRFDGRIEQWYVAIDGGCLVPFMLHAQNLHSYK